MEFVSAIISIIINSLHVFLYATTYNKFVRKLVQTVELLLQTWVLLLPLVIGSVGSVYQKQADTVS